MDGHGGVQDGGVGPTLVSYLHGEREAEAGEARISAAAAAGGARPMAGGAAGGGAAAAGGGVAAGGGEEGRTRGR